MKPYEPLHTVYPHRLLYISVAVRTGRQKGLPTGSFFVSYDRKMKTVAGIHYSRCIKKPFYRKAKGFFNINARKA